MGVIIWTVVSFIPFIGWMISWIISTLILLLGLILWLLLMYKAFMGERFKLPVVGDFAEKQISK